jgi:pyruvate dehydrogenase (quinone)
MASTTVGDKIVSRLDEWGVEQVFGYPGDGINGILAAMNRAGNKPRFVQNRHEEMSAFCATGYSKFAGKIGVCLATSGPGAIHLLNGLYDAKLDHVPVVAIVGQQASTALGGHFQQEVDLTTLYKDVAHHYVHMASQPEQFPMLIDRAMRTAMSERTVTCVIVPADLQEKEYTPPPHEFKMVPSSMGTSRPKVTPPDDVVREAADVINAGERLAILVGQGARRASDLVLQVAEKRGAGVAKALLGKDVVPDDHPLVTGPIGLLGSKPSDHMMMGCDTLLMVGSSFPYGQFLPDWDQARGVQIDIEAKMIGIRYPMEVNVVGDAHDTLEKLLPLLEPVADHSWEQEIRSEIERWWEILENRAMLDADPVNPQRVFWELSPQLPDNAIVTTDSGSATNWYARDLKFRADMRGSLSGTLATMGPGVPYAIGAKFAHPDRPVIACVGDGAMQMNGMNELLTISRFWQEWDDPRLIVLVLNNEDLNQVTWEMRAMAETSKFEASQSLPSFNYAAFAESVGLRGIRIEEPGDIAGAWQQAFASDRPVVVDALVDPEVPPIPPHTELDQVKSLTKALLEGDPAARRIITQGLKQKAQELRR